MIGRLVSGAEFACLVGELICNLIRIWVPITRKSCRSGFARNSDALPPPPVSRQLNFKLVSCHFMLNGNLEVIRRVRFAPKVSECPGVCI